MAHFLFDDDNDEMRVIEAAEGDRILAACGESRDTLRDHDGFMPCDSRDRILDQTGRLLQGPTYSGRLVGPFDDSCVFVTFSCNATMGEEMVPHRAMFLDGEALPLVFLGPEACCDKFEELRAKEAQQLRCMALTPYWNVTAADYDGEMALDGPIACGIDADNWWIRRWVGYVGDERPAYSEYIVRVTLVYRLQPIVHVFK